MHLQDGWLGHIFFSLCQQRANLGITTQMFVPSCELECRVPNLVETVPSTLKWLAYRHPTVPILINQWRLLSSCQELDGIYLMPTYLGSRIFEAIKKRDKPIFREMINCSTGHAKQILDDAYARIGIPPQHRVSDHAVTDEKRQLELADFILCPSSEVYRSIQEADIPENKLLLCSYGWSPQKFPNRPTHKQPNETPVFLFVGTACVRKGVHLLLRAWEKANIQGKLVICGRIELVIAEICSDILARPDVICQGFTLDTGSAYRNADVFIFPSLEEGSPLVAYEAICHGLPMLVSPMGGGGIIRDGIDGLMIPPYQEDRWIDAIRKLASSPELRIKFGDSARQRAEEFTWDKVAQRRARLIREKLNVRFA